jgi:hypothetical protein
MVRSRCLIYKSLENEVVDEFTSVFEKWSTAMKNAFIFCTYLLATMNMHYKNRASVITNAEIGENRDFQDVG